PLTFDRCFASSFLQIPRHHGHPFVELTSTSVFGVRDLHPIVHVHAGRTNQKQHHFFTNGVVLFTLFSFMQFFAILV
ncbi:hypothetical protein, partial [Ureibacillus thermosphaericus]|uniref:hypothetical protein n=1 Tax=Ureibacillus thermosphaericus TaxID=51173 RepID=UPI0030C8FF2E